MARYFFHLRDHVERLLDPEGRNIDSLDEIPALALKEARDVISQDALTGEIDLRPRLEVEDDQGNIVYSLDFDAAVRISRSK